MDTLGENSIARSRVLAYLVPVALRVVEAADLKGRVVAPDELLDTLRGHVGLRSP